MDAIALAVAALKADREQVRADHHGGLSGVAVARAQSDAMDRALVAMWEQVAAPSTALVALGGYGRGELSPHSDIDLMVLHDGVRGIEKIAEPLFYALWDAGLTVGHAVRTPKDCVRLAKENIEAETSFLRSRLIAGDKALYDTFAHDAVAATRKRSAAFVADVAQLMRTRHVVGGSATSQLEPNIKEGAGGLRDLHVLGWMQVVFGDLLDQGLIGAHERVALDDANEMLLRVRNHLHYLVDRPNDVLLFQYQKPIARFLCYLDIDRPAEDAFMRDLFNATRTVEHVVSAVMHELDARGRKQPKRRATDEPFVVESGRVVPVGQPDARPDLLVGIFALGAPLGAEASRWLEHALAPITQIDWTEQVRHAFLRLLRLGDAHALERADHAGVLARLLPGWERVRCQPQRNVYHRFTVDAHLFNTVAQARALLAGGEEDPLVRDVAADLGDPDGLLLAALLHDVGKGGDDDHSVTGEQIARDLLGRMGIGEPRLSTVAWLVRHHLLLVEAATRRDLNDENFILDVVDRIGDIERARMLFLLSVADGRSTGPSAWSPWKAALVGELFSKVAHVFDRGELATRDAVELVRLRTRELRDALSRHPVEQVDAHIDGISRAYVLAFPAQALIKHFALLSEAAATGRIRAHVAPTEERGVVEYVLAAPDRPGLFSKVSGVLALNGVNILTAQGYTRADGMAVEVFHCAGSGGQPPDWPRWSRVTEDAERALTGRLSLPVRLAEKRAAYARSVVKGKGEEPKVIIDNGASDFLTVIEVHAPDRIGLLYDITSALTDLTLDIQTAKIATYGEDVVDVFYVRDLDGQKVADTEQLAEIERTLLHRLRTG